jgi:hypothetical protein
MLHETLLKARVVDRQDFEGVEQTRVHRVQRT